GIGPEKDQDAARTTPDGEPPFPMLRVAPASARGGLRWRRRKGFAAPSSATGSCAHSHAHSDTCPQPDSDAYADDGNAPAGICVAGLQHRRSDGPLEHNAATAWNLGHTGQGVTIAIVDTGIDEDSPEF